MAQNVTIMGASYPDVPAVELPKTGGGTARFADPSVTTAVAADVAAGKIFLNAQGEPTEGTGSGGGGGANLRPPVTVTPDQNTQIIRGDTENYLIFASSVSIPDASTITFSPISWGKAPEQNSTYNIVVDFRRITKGRSYTLDSTVTWNGYGTTVTLNEVGSSRTVSMAINETSLVVTVGSTDDDLISSINIAITGELNYDGLEQVTVRPVAATAVTGTFLTASTAGVGSLSIPYSGSGYPIMAVVVVNGGAYVSGTNWYNSTQRYAVGQWTMTKSNFSGTPSYATSGASNTGVTTWVYKNSTSSSTNYSRSSAMDTNVFSSSNATNAGATCVRFKGNTTMSYYVNTNSYGLLPNTTYRYFVWYSE